MSAGVLKYTLIVRHPDTDAPTALLVGEEVPSWASKLVHADDLDGGASAVGKADGPKGYGDQKVDELKAVIAARNEGRDEDSPLPPVSDQGNKGDLVKALEADDAIESKSYGDLTVDTLKDLIARRNKGREDDALISDEGAKQDHVDALTADDAK